MPFKIQLGIDEYLEIHIYIYICTDIHRLIHMLSLRLQNVRVDLLDKVGHKLALHVDGSCALGVVGGTSSLPQLHR